MNSPTEEIKSRLDLVDFIQGYLRLHKAGINYKANCPFHSDKTPSFFVSPARQIWHCFGGCGEGGDIFKFVMKVEGLDFPEALRLLAGRAGIVLKREDPQIRSERNRLYEICEEATKIFEKSLSLIPVVQFYLKNRGVKEETIKEFRIGFAPKSWDFLLKNLVSMGFRREEIEKAGIIIKSNDGSSWYDRFRSRVMFPINDFNGRVVGFGGRIFEPDAGSRPPLASLASSGKPARSDSSETRREAVATEAKYINTPNTLIYDKSRILYGFDKAKHEVSIQNRAVLVEGYMDCAMSYQAGVKNTIAVSGTALTSYQLKILRRLADGIFCSFDTDLAGDSATKRTLALASEFDFERKIIQIPSGKDPADTVKEDPELWRKAVIEAKSVVEFYFHKAFSKYDPRTPEGKKGIASIVIPFMVEIRDEIQKAHWAQELSRRLGVPEESVWKEVSRKKITNSIAPVEVGREFLAKPIFSRRELLEERFLSLLLMVKEDLRLRVLENSYLAFGSLLNNEAFELLKSGSAPDTAHSKLGEYINILRFKGEVLKETSDSLEDELMVSKKEFEKECIKEKLLKIGDEINKVERDGNRVVTASLLNDFRELSNKLRMLF